MNDLYTVKDGMSITGVAWNVITDEVTHTASYVPLVTGDLVVYLGEGRIPGQWATWPVVLTHGGPAVVHPSHWRVCFLCLL